MGLLLRRIEGWSGLRHTKSGRLLLHCCFGGTVQSSKYWRLVPGHLRAPSPPFIFKMSPTGIRTPFPWALWWQLKRLCNSLAFWLWCCNSHSGLLVTVCDVQSPGPPCPACDGCRSFTVPLSLDQESYRKPYIRESLVSRWSSFFVTVNHLSFMAVVIMSSYGDVSAKNLAGHSLSLPIASAVLLWVSPLLALCVVLYSLLICIVPEHFIVPSPNGPLKKEYGVQKRKLTQIQWTPSHLLHESDQMKGADLSSAPAKEDVISSHPSFARYKLYLIILAAHFRLCVSCRHFYQLMSNCLWA